MDGPAAAASVEAAAAAAAAAAVAARTSDVTYISIRFFVSVLLDPVFTLDPAQHFALGVRLVAHRYRGLLICLFAQVWSFLCLTLCLLDFLAVCVCLHKYSHCFVWSFVCLTPFFF